MTEPLAPNAVRIAIAYAGINRADLLQKQGLYPPPEGGTDVPGLEVSGHVLALGEGVTGFALGQPVCALLGGGAYAARVDAPAGQVVPIPEGISLAEAAALPEAAATSYMALRDGAQLQAGERVLLHGGSSGVGYLMAQIAHAWGGEVFSTVGGPEKAALMKEIGVHPLDHTQGHFADQLMELTQKQGVDVVVDTLGGQAFAQHLRLLRPRGRLVLLALLQGSQADGVKLSSILMKHLQIHGMTLRSRTADEKARMMAGVRAAIWPLVASGAVRPRIDSIFPLAEVEKAHQRMEERLHLGKILLEVPA